MRPRTQATLDLVLYFVFFIPGIAALIYAGTDYAADSWRIAEHSNVTADGPPVYHFKTVIPVAGVLLLLQGIVEIVRCIVCLQRGTWPSRGEDVEEVDVDKLKEMVHVKDEDIEKLDTIVTAHMAVLRQRVGAGHHEHRAVQHDHHVEGPCVRMVERVAREDLPRDEQRQAHDQPRKRLPHPRAEPVDQEQQPLHDAGRRRRFTPSSGPRACRSNE
jgi:hypothetical protein